MLFSDASHNLLSGSIPSPWNPTKGFGATNLTTWYLQNNAFTSFSWAAGWAQNCPALTYLYACHILMIYFLELRTNCLTT